MFNRSARWFFPGQDVKGVVDGVGHALYQRSVSLVPFGPMRWKAECPAGPYGLTPKVWLTVLPDRGGFWVDVRVWADLSPGSIVFAVLTWSFCFPVGIIFLLLGSQSWNRQSDDLLATMQQPVGHLQSAPQWNAAPPFGH